ncbi:Tim44 domain-containing protein [Roseateles violae]|uniref:Tim44-like domain-containing protein n=1 Tax=Roseateles violae TaxID=3058042 RepID=A0ABT8DY46_9BURK|nr:Tim44-like domain-containing protein [Pelomonas sp. PFR6]MDN3921916.1 Tim44-like domain-containing protein [Pelomonas sp. PFR6]
MKRIALTLLVAALSLGLPALDAEAKRIGGGGMKRSIPTQSSTTPPPKPATPTQQQQAAPAQQAAPTQTAAAPAAAAAPAKRSWMGPIAGLAAGLGLAALASHFGFGEALANVMTMVLIGIVAMMLIGFLMRRFGKAKAQPQGMQYAGAGAPFPQQAQPQPMAYQPQAAAAPVAAADDGFDTAGFEQIAKRVFIRLQAANDNADQADLRRFTTPEMYGVIQQELLDRKNAKQSTEVLQLDARVVDRAVEEGQQVVSVRFWGLIREQSEAAAEHFDEVWHLVRPQDESRDWAIAGIQVTA